MYKVNVIAHALKNNRVAYHGDIVSEADLNGNSKDLLSQGFIVKATDKEVAAAKKSKGNDELDLDKPLGEMKKAELIAKAESLGVDLSEATNNEARAKTIQDHLDANKGE